MQGFVDGEGIIMTRTDGLRADSNGTLYTRPSITLPNGTVVRPRISASRYDLPNTRAGVAEAERRVRNELLATTTTAINPHPTPATFVAAPTGAPVVKEIPTFRAFVATWRAYGDVRKNKLATRKTKAVFAKRATAFFGDLPIDQIDLPRIHAWQQSMRDLGARSMNLYLAHLSGLLHLAHAYKHIAEVPSIEKVPVPPTRETYLTMTECDRLIAHADPLIRDAVDFATRTGLRIGEWRQLRWTNVDLDRRVIHIVENVVVRTVGSPKSGRGRQIPITPHLDAMLRRRRAAAPAATFVFGGPRDGRIKEGTAYKLLAAAYANAGIPRPPGQAWHHCRHTFASHLAKRQPLNVVSKLLGHSTIVMTQRYAHLQAGDLENAMACMDAGRTLGGDPGAHRGGDPGAVPSGPAAGADLAGTRQLAA